MPQSITSLFPYMDNTLSIVKTQLAGEIQLTNMVSQYLKIWEIFLKHNSLTNFLSEMNKYKQTEIEFLDIFQEDLSYQKWNEYGEIIIDLPGMKLIDISLKKTHKINNYGVVFAPRAGHHSNIAERVATYMRDEGLTRMAIVEQKCADEIPMYVGGIRHYENFESQISQYTGILETLKNISGYPSHVIAVCQPGPLAMMTTILRPDLVKTFGSSGSPMDTDGEKGFLSDFTRFTGESFINNMINFFGYTVPKGKIGEGRKCFDGKLQVLAFYILGAKTHAKNFKKLFNDLYENNEDAIERQKSFYEWYNLAYHSSQGFIKDTFIKIFKNNELIKGEIEIENKKIGINDYPKDVPIWALGGSKDDIAPLLQAVNHLNLMNFIPNENKLKLIADGGHMAIFRSGKILRKYYSQIVKFIIDNSNNRYI